MSCVYPPPVGDIRISLGQVADRPFVDRRVKRVAVLVERPMANFASSEVLVERPGPGGSLTRPRAGRLRTRAGSVPVRPHAARSGPRCPVGGVCHRRTGRSPRRSVLGRHPQDARTRDPRATPQSLRPRVVRRLAHRLFSVRRGRAPIPARTPPVSSRPLSWPTARPAYAPGARTAITPPSRARALARRSAPLTGSSCAAPTPQVSVDKARRGGSGAGHGSVASRPWHPRRSGRTGGEDGFAPRRGMPSGMLVGITSSTRTSSAS